MGTPEQDLANYLHQEYMDEAFDQYIEGKADELLEGEYNPFIPENICEGMSEMSDADLKDIGKCLERATDEDAKYLMATMNDVLNTYWRQRAREEAIRRHKHGDYDNYD